MARSHVIDGVTYVEVDRYAKEGDKIISKLTEYVFDVILGGLHGKAFTQGGGYISKENYNVLEPLKPSLSELCAKITPENRHEEVTVDGTQASEQVIASVDESQASAAVVNMFTALSRKIVSLERQLAATQRNLETFAEQTENNSEDIRTLDERTQVVNAIVKFYEGSRR
jgi:hypothetical protein